ncbi:hypothetical protein [Streptomyces sp. Ag109_O5-10]|uniref:hypothetical protein n=1 Tax=Streptomyces sp. Ag109_O5-10 TaxID=1855349 RepID=UPI000894E3D5|nr:hypothetical protein [Streptomyces sp. Ag109_O5-10]SEF16737.1 hypothetical protein SAMN05216533_7959 [Streptomyces sp. Ag109_O5-10]
MTQDHVRPEWRDAALTLVLVLVLVLVPAAGGLPAPFEARAPPRAARTTPDARVTP